MPTLQGSTVTAAGQVTANVLAGSIYEYAPFDCMLEIGVVDEATGEQRVTVISGSDVLMEESPISIANRFPVYPDDFTMSDYAAAGDRIVIRVRNTGAASRTLRWVLKITPAV